MVTFACGAFLASFPYDMFNDAQYFLEQARNSQDRQSECIRWRFLRASILFSLNSIEAYVNTLIIDLLRGWGLNEVAEEYPNTRLSWEKKIDIIIPWLTGKKVDKKQKFWGDFVDARKIRTILVHYCGSAYSDVYDDNAKPGVNLLNAERAHGMVKDMVKHLCELVGQNSPSWVDQATSRTIE